MDKSWDDRLNSPKSGVSDFWIFGFGQIRARMQRGGHGCSVEGTWVGRTREPAGPDVDLVRTETKKIKSLRELICLLVSFVLKTWNGVI